MTQEEKQLLLKDLSCRIPYGVIVDVDENHKVMMEFVNWYEEVSVDDGSNDLYTISQVRPYLRPLSSMTPEEKKYIKYKWGYSDWDTLNDFINYTLIDTCDAESFIDWLNANYFDYRGLIEKGLAIEAPDGMY